MLWIKAFHIIFMVTWFAGLFYLPRLFVYHADCTDETSHQRFKVMESRLFYAITTPGGILTTVFGIWLLTFNFSYYMQQGWMHAKLFLILLLWAYHIACWKYVGAFARNSNRHSAYFYRWFNEFPSLILVVVVILVVVRPF